MKKQPLLLCLFLVCCNLVFCQQKQVAEQVVEEGIVLYDKGNYEEAITKYNLALQLDEDNFSALYEKAMTLIALQRYEETIEICRHTLEIYTIGESLAGIYVSYGTAYSYLKNPDKAVEIYNKGIKKFPNDYMLHFNKGITLSNVGEYDSAIICFQNSAQLNPQHAGSHNALGNALDMQGKRIPALLAYCRFLVLEPGTKRSQINMARLQKIINGNVQQTGNKSISIIIAPDDTTVKENKFSTIEMLLALSSALDYEKKYKREIEIKRFIRKIETICSMFKETQKENSGFYWDYYVPYFIEMKDKNLIKTFAYIVFASSDNPNINKWIKSHPKDINIFYEWSNNFAFKTKCRKIK